MKLLWVTYRLKQFEVIPAQTPSQVEFDGTKTGAVYILGCDDANLEVHWCTLSDTESVGRLQNTVLLW